MSIWSCTAPSEMLAMAMSNLLYIYTNFFRDGGGAIRRWVYSKRVYRYICIYIRQMNRYMYVYDIIV